MDFKTFSYKRTLTNKSLFFRFTHLHQFLTYPSSHSFKYHLKIRKHTHHRVVGNFACSSSLPSFLFLYSFLFYYHNYLLSHSGKSKWMIESFSNSFPQVTTKHLIRLVYKIRHSFRTSFRVPCFPFFLE
ncbi:unnamed protein product [Vicia faba]|uniref:Uncharacterized protein n=1 Tax=Vicia faba TaxID=3906 RepID=A0AAV0YF64_VICFA|nr:unnamed protein product [Vicia faba]